jgi:hypothetical protein
LILSFRNPQESKGKKSTAQPGDAIEDAALKPGFGENVKIPDKVVESPLFMTP